MTWHVLMPKWVNGKLNPQPRATYTVPSSYRIFTYCCVEASNIAVFYLQSAAINTFQLYKILNPIGGKENDKLLTIFSKFKHVFPLCISRRPRVFRPSLQVPSRLSGRPAGTCESAKSQRYTVLGIFRGHYIPAEARDWAGSRRRHLLFPGTRNARIMDLLGTN